MTQAASAVVRKQIVIEAPAEKAFSVFTERLGDFKPPERADGSTSALQRTHK